MGVELTQIRTVIIDANQLFREGLQRLLDPEDFDVRGTEETLADAPTAVAAAGGVDLVIFDLARGAVEEDLQVLRDLRMAYPRMRLILLGNILSPDIVGGLTGVRLDGYLPKNLSPEALNYSLNLILLGVNVFPPELMFSESARSSDMGDSEHVVELESLSRRELEVLQCLTAGYPNKVIARDLQIKEATVKVHLKSILRKLNVSNRTQAAMIALEQGIEEIGAPAE